MEEGRAGPTGQDNVKLYWVAEGTAKLGIGQVRGCHERENLSKDTGLVVAREEVTRQWGR